MIDIFMLVMIIILSLFLIGLSIYMLAYYVSPDDNKFGGGIVCKIFSVMGLCIGWGQILLLPLDVSNTRDTNNSMRMDIVWQVVYIVIAVFVFVIIPLLISFYEVDPEWSCAKKVTNGLCFFFGELIVVILLFGICYIFMHKAKIPTKTYACDYNYQFESDKEIPEDFKFNVNNTCKVNEEDELEITVGFPIYAMAFLSFLSYILFSVFGGVGLFALPMDLIHDFRTRPIKLNPAKLEELKKEVVETAIDLKEKAKIVKEMEKNGDDKKFFFTAAKRKYNALLKELRTSVNILDDEYQVINQQNLLQENSALLYYLGLVGGVFFLIITFLWILQILLYVVIKKNKKPLARFLNAILVYLTEHFVHFIAVVIFSVLTFYLLICTIKGNLKFGLRMGCCGQIHPMKKNNTYMNSFLFNVGLSMLSSMSVVHFAVKAFNEYAAMTEIDIIFTTQIQYLNFFKIFFKNNIFEYILLGFMVLTFFYLMIKPSDVNTLRKILYKKEAELDEKMKNKEKEPLLKEMEEGENIENKEK